MTVSRRRFLEQATTLGVAGVAASTGALSLLSSGAAQAQAAVGYEVLSTPMNTADPDKVEVLEFFWFGCPHCYAFEPTINEYHKNIPDHVAFVREAPPLNPQWEQHSRIFYAARSLGIVDQIVDPVFNEIHQNRKRLRKPKNIGKFIESLDVGVDSEKFQKTMKSFAVDAGLRRSTQLAQQSGITGVPAILVNGKYRTSVSMAGGDKAVISVIERLVELERS